MAARFMCSITNNRENFDIFNGNINFESCQLNGSFGSTFRKRRLGWEIRKKYPQNTATRDQIKNTNEGVKCKNWCLVC